MTRTASAPAYDATAEMSAPIADRGQLWKRSRPRKLMITSVGLAWGNEASRAVVPWVAVLGCDIDPDGLVVRYVWPYVRDGEAELHFQVEPAASRVFCREILARAEVARGDLDAPVEVPSPRRTLPTPAAPRSAAAKPAPAKAVSKRAAVKKTAVKKPAATRATKKTATKQQPVRGQTTRRARG